MKTSVTSPIKIILASLAGFFPWQGGEAQELASELRALQPIEIAYPSYGVEVGSGWDALLGRKTNSTCVQFIEIDLQKTAFSHNNRVIRNSYELSRSSFASLSGSVDWGFIDASVSGSYDRSESIKRDSANILSQFTFEVGSTQAANVRTLQSDEDLRLSERELLGINRGTLLGFTPEIQALLNDDSLTETQRRVLFRQACGTGYVASVRRGARISVLATRDVSNTEEKQRIEASASASGWGVSFSGKFIDTEQATTRDQRAQIRILQEGGSELIKFDKDFNPETFSQSIDVSTVYTNPSAFSATVFPYTSVAGAPYDLVGTTFPMADYSRLYFFLNDLLGMYNEAARDIYLTQYDSTAKPEEFAYSNLSIASVGGENEVLANRDNIRRTIRALLTALEDCYYEEADFAEGTCSIETSLDQAKTEFAFGSREQRLKELAGQKFADEAEFTNMTSRLRLSPDAANSLAPDFGLSFLFATTNQTAQEAQFDPATKTFKMVATSSPALNTDLTPLGELARQLFRYAVALPVRNGDLNVSVMSKHLDIPAHELWSKDENKPIVQRYIRDRIFFLRLYPMREELCQVGAGAEICLDDVELHAMLASLSLDLDAKLFPTEPEKPPVTTPPKPRPPVYYENCGPGTIYYCK